MKKKNETNEDQLCCKFTIKSNHLLWRCLRSNKIGTNNAGTNSNTNNSSKRKRKIDSTSTHKHHAGNNSNNCFLHRINIKNPENSKFIHLKNGKGICSFHEGSVEKIGVIDENRIDVYDQDLTFERSICKNLEDNPFGVSFYDDQFFVTNTNYYSIFNLNPNDLTKECGQLKPDTKIRLQRTIHKKNFHYILLEDCFVCNLRTLEDPIFIELFVQILSKLSDFVMIDENSALIVVSGSTKRQILRYDISSNDINSNVQELIEQRGFTDFDDHFFGEHKVGKLSPVTINGGEFFNNGLEMPHGICVWKNHILISVANGITIVDKTNFIKKKEIPLSYSPGKLAATENYIFTIVSPSSLDENESLREKKDISVGKPQRELNPPVVRKRELNPIVRKLFEKSRNDDSSDINEYNINCFKEFFSSVLITSPFLQHLKEEMNKIDNLVLLLNDEMVRLTLNEIFHPNHLNFNWNRMCFWFKVLNLQYIHDHKKNAHISMNLQTTNRNKNFEKLGSIVFINSEWKYSYLNENNENAPFAIGIICKEDEETIHLHHGRNDDVTSISVFGCTFVRVFVPTKYKSIDKRGMFVIINTHCTEKDNIGVGEIISFGDLHLRDSNSYHIVGCCTLDDFSNIILCSCEEENTLIPFPLHDNFFVPDNICFVSMVSLPMTKKFLNNFIPISGITDLSNITQPEHFPTSVDSVLQTLVKNLITPLNITHL